MHWSSLAFPLPSKFHVVFFLADLSTVDGKDFVEGNKFSLQKSLRLERN